MDVAFTRSILVERAVERKRPDRRRDGVGKRHPEESPHQGQHECFGDHLRLNVPPSRAERAPFSWSLGEHSIRRPVPRARFEEWIVPELMAIEEELKFRSLWEGET